MFLNEHGMLLASPYQKKSPTTASVSIISSPQGRLEHNKPTSNDSILGNQKALSCYGSILENELMDRAGHTNLGSVTGTTNWLVTGYYCTYWLSRRP